MDFSGIPLFRAISKRMAWLGERQQVLAQNVSNADTPGYVARDLKPLSFRDMVAGAGMPRPGMAATSGKHFSGGGVQRAVFDVRPAAAAERTPSGNRVDMEREMMKVGETASEHRLAATLYRKHMAMIRAALGRGAT
jgi:flagellar basal-body rod protein FlgB